MTEHGAILFYRVDEPYGFMSNFARYPIQVDGREWPTSDHYFQAQKFAGLPEEEQVRAARAARDAAYLGPLRGLRSDWDAVKDEVMLKALRAKFTQHPGSAHSSSPPATGLSSSTRRTMRTGRTVVTAPGTTASVNC